MRTLIAAEETYKSTYPKVGYACNLSQLGGKGGSPEESGLIDNVLASGKKSGFTYSITNCSATTYRVSAVPDSKANGRRAFCADQSAVIRYSDDGSAESCFKSGNRL